MRRLERESAERMRRLEKEFADKERFLDDKYSAESKSHRGEKRRQYDRFLKIYAFFYFFSIPFPKQIKTTTGAAFVFS